MPLAERVRLSWWSRRPAEPPRRRCPNALAERDPSQCRGYIRLPRCRGKCLAQPCIIFSRNLTPFLQCLSRGEEQSSPDRSLRVDVGDGPRGQTDTIADGPLAPRTASRTAVRHLTGRISARTSLCFVGYRRCSGNGLSSCLPLFRFRWCSNALHAVSFILIGLAIASLGLPLTTSIPNKPLARILPQQRLQL